MQEISKLSGQVGLKSPAHTFGAVRPARLLKFSSPEGFVPCTDSLANRARRGSIIVVGD
ncbi:MAG: hypothetical protein FWC00_06525 [Firmicutes bacterium]|nr:hypothetical protein [Bacillota bacterium]